MSGAQHNSSHDDEEFVLKIKGFPPNATKEAAIQWLEKELSETHKKDVNALKSEGIIESYDVRSETKKATVNIWSFKENMRHDIEKLKKSKTLGYAESVEVHDLAEYHQVVISGLAPKKFLHEKHLSNVFGKQGFCGKFGIVDDIYVDNIQLYAIVKYCNLKAFSNGSELFRKRFDEGLASLYQEADRFPGRSKDFPANFTFRNFQSECNYNNLKFKRHHMACYSVCQKDDNEFNTGSNTSNNSKKFSTPADLRGSLTGDYFDYLRDLNMAKTLEKDTLEKVHRERISRTRVSGDSIDLLLQRLKGDKDLLKECDFVFIQGLLVTIGTSANVYSAPFDSGEEVVVQKVDGVHYMYNRSTLQSKVNTARNNLNTNWRQKADLGKAFEHAMTTPTKSKDKAKQEIKKSRKKEAELLSTPNHASDVQQVGASAQEEIKKSRQKEKDGRQSDASASTKEVGSSSTPNQASDEHVKKKEDMNENHDFFLIVKAQLSNAGTVTENQPITHGLVYASECDCFNPEPTFNSFGEIKMFQQIESGRLIPKYSNQRDRAACTVFKTWLQCYLGGIDHIFYGFYTENCKTGEISIVDSKRYSISELHYELEVDGTFPKPETILGNLYSFLSYVKNCVNEQHRPFLFKREKMSLQWECKELTDKEARSYVFLPRWFADENF